MKNWKILITAVALSLVLLGTLVGCAGGTSPSPTATAKPTVPTTAPTTSPATTVKPTVPTATPTTSPTPSASPTAKPTFEKITLTISHQYPINSAICKNTRKFEELVGKYTDGAVTFKHYCEGELYKGYELATKACSAGELDMALISQSGLVGAGLKEMEVATVFGLFSVNGKNCNEAVQAFDQKAQLDKLAEQKANVKMILSFKEADPTVIFTTKKKLESVYDLKGLKIRGTANMAWRLFMQETGMIYTSLPSSEVYMAAQTGLIDGAIGGFEGTITRKVYEVLPYLANYCLYPTPYYLVMNLKKWNSLSPALQKVILENVAPETVKASIATNDAERIPYLETARTKAQLYEIPDRMKTELESIYPLYWSQYALQTGWDNLLDIAKECRKQYCGR